MQLAVWLTGLCLGLFWTGVGCQHEGEGVSKVRSLWLCSNSYKREQLASVNLKPTCIIDNISCNKSKSLSYQPKSDITKHSTTQDNVAFPFKHLVRASPQKCNKYELSTVEDTQIRQIAFVARAWS